MTQAQLLAQLPPTAAARPLGGSLSAWPEGAGAAHERVVHRRGARAFGAREPGAAAARAVNRFELR